jgi:enoyl-CoA hydratase
MAFVEFTAKEQIGILTINRPNALNALNDQVISELDKVLDSIDVDTIRCVIVTGAGEKAFVAGADIAQMSKLTKAEGEAFGKLGNDVFRKLETLPVPTIAAVNGFALGGGCELCMSCDIRLASDTAVFGQPEVGLGITPGFGGTQRMARIIGTGAAMELIYTADTIDAKRALEIGLVQHVVPAEELMDFAMAMANKIASKAQVAIRTSKMAIRRGIDCDISTAATYEALAFATCFATEDQKDAMKAFVEKRKLEKFKNH